MPTELRTLQALKNSYDAKNRTEGEDLDVMQSPMLAQIEMNFMALPDIPCSPIRELVSEENTFYNQKEKILLFVRLLKSDNDRPPAKTIEIQRYTQIEQALLAVEESEADLGLPKGNHYLLYEVLRRILGVHTTKETMKDVARKALDNGFDPD